MSNLLPLHLVSSQDRATDAAQSPKNRLTALSTTIGQSSRWKSFKGAWYGGKTVLMGSWLHALLVFIPVTGILVHSKTQSNVMIFFLCIISLIPLVKLHDLCIRTLAARLGGNRTGLINASMSNIIEIIVAFIALRKCELRVVQTTLIGFILSKLLLVLGLCFLAGGIRFREQTFGSTATQVNTSMLNMSVAAVLLPGIYHFAVSGSASDAVADDWQKSNILRMSHSVSLVLLFVYIAYLFFQLWSHTHIYEDITEKSNPHTVQAPAVLRIVTKDNSGLHKALSLKSLRSNKGVTTGGRHTQVGNSDETLVTSSQRQDEVIVIERTVSNGSDTTLPRSQSPISDSGRGNSRNGSVEFEPTEGMAGGSPEQGNLSHSSTLSADNERDATNGPPAHDSLNEQEKEAEKKLLLGIGLNLVLLIGITAVVAVVAEWLVDSLDGTSEKVDKTWVGLILLPAVSSLAECITAVNVSVKDQLTLSVSVAVGSSIQTALFVIPLMVTLGWIMDKPLALLFDPFESIVLYVSVQTMGHVIGDGESNWLEGFILISLYFVIAVAFWFYPDEGNLAGSFASTVCQA